MSNKPKVLIITEGKKTEPKLYRKAFELFPLFNKYEIYSYKELYQLKCEIFATVKPLVSIQQTMEAQINNSESIEDVLKINIDYSAENIKKYLNIVKVK